MKIYSRTGSELTALDTSHASVQRTVELGGADNLTLNVMSSQGVGVPALSYINPKKTDTQDLPEDRFYLLDDYKPLDTDTGFQYTLIFEHFSKLFQQAEFYFEDAQGLRQYSWALSANLETAASQILLAIQREFPTLGVTLGALQTGTVLTDLVFDGMNVYEAMAYVAEQFKVEMWWYGTELHFGKAEYNTRDPHKLTHGINIQDAISVEYDEVRPQYIRPLGGVTNMPVSAEGAISYQGRLPMPEGQEVVEITGISTGVTLNITNDEIFPSMGGKVTEVTYNGDPENPIYYIKADIEYKLADVRLENGESVVMYFTSGQLGGREFNVDDYDQEGTIEIFRTESNGIFIPREYLAPEVGDTFLLKNVTINEAEIQEAQNLLAEWANEYANAIRNKAPKITLVTNSPYYLANPHTFQLGEAVQVTHPSIVEGSVTARVAGYSYNLAETSLVELSINSESEQGRVQTLENAVKELTVGLNAGTALPISTYDTRYIRKDKDDEVKGELTMQKGIKSNNFDPLIRSGYNLFKDELGRGILQVNVVEADELQVDTLTFNKIQAVGGTIVVSKAWMSIERIEDLEEGYKFYYKPEDKTQIWRAGDQPRMSNAGRLFWGVVTEVSSVNELADEHYILCSKLPDNIVGDFTSVRAKDEFVLWGHRGSDESRKNLTVISSGSSDNPYPSFSQYFGIDSFDLSDLENKTSAVISKDVKLGVGRAKILVEPERETIKLLGDGVYFGKDEDKLTSATSLIEGFETLPSYEFLKDTFANGNTIIKGGAIVSSALMLGYVDPTSETFKVMAGVNGVITDASDPSDVAFWAGGDLVDRGYGKLPIEECSDVGAIYVQRHDGSGYIAGGGIYWGAAGSNDLYANLKGLTVDIDGGQVDISILFNRIAEIYEFIGFNRDSKGLPESLEVKTNLFTNFASSAGGYDPTQGSGGGGIDMSEVWSALATPTQEQINISHLPVAQIIAEVPTVDLSAYVTNSGLATALSGYVKNDLQIIAGNGLTGGGALTANRTLTLGTPSTISISSTNSVGTSTHSHYINRAGIGSTGIVALTTSLATTSNTIALAGSVGKTLNDKIISLENFIKRNFLEESIDGENILKLLKGTYSESFVSAGKYDPTSSGGGASGNAFGVMAFEVIDPSTGARTMLPIQADTPDAGLSFLAGDGITFEPDAESGFVRISSSGGGMTEREMWTHLASRSFSPIAEQIHYSHLNSAFNTLDIFSMIDVYELGQSSPTQISASVKTDKFTLRASGSVSLSVDPVTKTITIIGAK